MKRLIHAGAAAGLVAGVLALAGCPSASSPSGGGTLSITSSAGTLTGSGGSWSFDAGSVPQYTTENVTFTVSNTTSAGFNATGSQTFTPTGDFSDSISGNFTVAAGSSNSFIGSFTPTNTPVSQETGALTLTPSTGSPMVINLKGTSIASFQVYEGTRGTAGTLVTNGITVAGGYFSTYSFSIANVSTSATVTLTGSSPVSSSNNTQFAITQPSSTVIAAGGSSYVTFVVTDTNGLAGSTTITVQGVDSTTNAPFQFSFTLTGYGAG